MGSTELAANLFRATQTEEKLRKDKIRGKQKANLTHYEIGKKVRKTIEEIAMGTGHKVKVLDRVPIADSINAARTLFSKCYFDRVNCEEGLQCLRHYRYDVDPETKQFSQKPLHDHYSNGADAFRYIGLMINEPRKVVKRTVPHVQSSWMG